MRTCRVEDVEKALSQSGCQVIDVREPAEHGAAKIAGTTNLPLSALGPQSAEGLHKDRPVYLVCRSGARARQAAERLQRMGFGDLRVLEGGIQAWTDSGHAVVQAPSTVWNLERQVRFAAGFLVILGAMLAWKFHPAWIGLSVFVGAGLVFSAVTDTCGMAMLLARMPWNQKAGQP